MIIRGISKWAKVIGEPGWGYKNQHKEWSVDVYVDEETVHKLTTEGLADKLKDKGDGPFLQFRRKELKHDGRPNAPIRVVDKFGEPWNQEVSIGNGSTVNVNFAVNEYGDKGEKSLNILSMQVWDLVEYKGGEFPVAERPTDDSWADGAAA